MQAEQLLNEPEIHEESPFIRQLTSTAILTVSIAMGVIGNFLFYDNLPGINIPLYTALFLLVSAGLLYAFRHRVAYKHGIFAAPALIFALLLSFYSTPELVLYNLLMIAGSLLIFVRFATTPQFIGGHWLNPILYTIEMGLIGWLDGPITVLLNSSKWFNSVKINQEHKNLIGAVLRGLMITLPILLVFALLLASADAIFSDFLSDSFSWMLPDNLSDLIAQLMVIGFLTWVCISAFKILLMGQVGITIALPEKRKPAGFHLSMIETGMVLGSVDVLFLGFVVIQAKYLFGGEANITAQGYTYSEYARRGFFELLAVSAMTMALVVVLDWLTVRHEKQERLFLVLTSGLTALTVVMLVAAFMRLNLYEDAYGYTRLRVMTKVFMVWLGVLFAILLADIFYRHKNIFLMGCIITGMGFVLTLNLMNLDGFIAGRNIEHYEETGKLDVLYLLTLSDDAIPTIAPLLENQSLSENDRQLLLEGLGNRLYKLDNEKRERNFFGYHYGKAQAWEALDNYRDELAPYIRADFSFYVR